jgi:hypothetical protein
MDQQTRDGMPAGECCCATLPDLAVVPMGGGRLDERVFNTLEHVQDHGGDLWWLYLSKCSACGENWMIAQEERIFDDYFLKRLSNEEARQIVSESTWPPDFITYERVLKVGKALSQPCIFLNPLDDSLAWTAADLRKARPDITVEEIADLLGVTLEDAARLSPC